MMISSNDTLETNEYSAGDLDRFLADLKVEDMIGAGKRTLYYTQITLDEGEYKAILYMYAEEMSLVAIRAGQAGRFRRYTWSYKQITRVGFDKDGDRSRMFLRYKIIDDSLQSEDNNVLFNELDIKFPSPSICEKFGFRIKTLTRIYHPKINKNIPSATKAKVQDNQDFEEPEKKSKFFTYQIKEKDTPFERIEPQPSTSRPMDSSSAQLSAGSRDSIKPANRPIIDEMFSVENLEKLAKITTPPISVESVFKMPILDHIDSGFSSSSSAMEVQQLTSLTTDTKVIVPVAIPTPDEDGHGCTLNAEALIKLKLSVDMKGIQAAQSIQDNEARVRRIRELIRLETTQCQISFI